MVGSARINGPVTAKVRLMGGALCMVLGLRLYVPAPRFHATCR